MSAFSSLRDRLAAMPLDRGPLRRAGVLTVLLVVLLAVTQLWRPDRSRPAAASADRQDVQAAAETRSGGGLPVGQVAALLLLGAGGLGALYLRRRPAAAPRAAELDVIESRTIGPGQSLQLVACGGEVLLLSVGADGARLLCQWPADTFDAAADGLAAVAAAPSLRMEPAPVVAPEPAPVFAESDPGPTVLPIHPIPAPPVAMETSPVAVAEARPAVPSGTVPRQFAPAEPAAPSFATFLAEAARG